MVIETFVGSTAFGNAVDKEHYRQTQRGNVRGMVSRSSYAPLLNNTQPFFYCCPDPGPYLLYPVQAPEAWSRSVIPVSASWPDEG